MEEDNPAHFARAAYELDTKGSHEERVEKAQKYIDRETTGGWRVDPENSNRHMTVFINPEEIHISHRGTNVLSPRDLLTDVSIALGLERKDSVFSLRKTKTENVLKKYPDRRASASGHSMGGSTLYDSALSNKYIAERLKQIDILNPGVSVFRKRVSPKRHTDLKGKITVHRTRGDPVSQASIVNGLIGKLKTYKTKVEHKNLPQRLLASALNVGFVQKSLDAHSIDNFY